MSAVCQVSGGGVRVEVTKECDSLVISDPFLGGSGLGISAAVLETNFFPSICNDVF